MGRKDMGRKDMGRKDMGRKDVGRKDMGRKDVGGKSDIINFSVPFHVVHSHFNNRFPVFGKRQEPLKKPLHFLGRVCPDADLN